MRSRNTYLASVALIVTTALFILVCYLARPGVTRMNYVRIRPGMTLKQVRHLMGTDGRELPPDSSVQTFVDGRPTELLRGERKYQWTEGYIEIRVGFDNNGVATKHIHDGWTDLP